MIKSCSHGLKIFSSYHCVSRRGFKLFEYCLFALITVSRALKKEPYVIQEPQVWNNNYYFYVQRRKNEYY